MRRILRVLACFLSSRNSCNEYIEISSPGPCRTVKEINLISIYNLRQYFYTFFIFGFWNFIFLSKVFIISNLF